MFVITIIFISSNHLPATRATETCFFVSFSAVFLMFLETAITIFATCLETVVFPFYRPIKKFDDFKRLYVSSIVGF